jgi:chemotaxis family two-component system response regulator Rcp1
MTILLVEDNPADARLVLEALSQPEARCRVTIAHDGDEALAMLRRDSPHAAVPAPDLILLDLNLPKKHGHAVLAELKSSAAWRHIPVVVLTSSQAPEDVRQSYALHANAYIVKPTEFEDFGAVVGTLTNFWGGVAALPKTEVTPAKPTGVQR